MHEFKTFTPRKWNNKEKSMDLINAEVFFSPPFKVHCIMHLARLGKKEKKTYHFNAVCMHTNTHIVEYRFIFILSSDDQRILVLCIYIVYYRNFLTVSRSVCEWADSSLPCLCYALTQLIYFLFDDRKQSLR